MYSVVLMAALTAGADTPAWHRGCSSCYSCSGCYGCYGCHGSPPNIHPLGVPVVPGPAGKPEEKMPAPEKKTRGDGPARLLVNLPTDAKLYVDDQLMKTGSERREFNTPELAK